MGGGFGGWVSVPRLAYRSVTVSRSLAGTLKDGGDSGGVRSLRFVPLGRPMTEVEVGVLYLQVSRQVGPRV